MKKVFTVIFITMVILFVILPNRIVPVEEGKFFRITTLNHMAEDESYPTDYKVTIFYESNINNAEKTNFGFYRLVDERNQVYSLFNYSDRKGGMIVSTSDKDKSFTYRFPLSQVPLENGKVYFKTEISINDLPTQNISLLVRE